MTIFSALKASNLIQSLETMGPAVTLEKSLSSVLIPLEILQPCHLATFIGTAAYHGVHSVIALRVGHECFAKLVHLLVFQFLKTDLVNVRQGLNRNRRRLTTKREGNNLRHFVAMRHLVPDLSTIVAGDHNLVMSKIENGIRGLVNTFLPILGSMSAGPGSSNLG